VQTDTLYSTFMVLCSKVRVRQSYLTQYWDISDVSKYPDCGFTGSSKSKYWMVWPVFNIGNSPASGLPPGQQFPVQGLNLSQQQSYLIYAKII